MANLPRFGYTRQRFSEPRPGSASRLDVQPSSEPEYFSSAPSATTNILQTSPSKERWRISAPSSPKTFNPTYISPPRSPAKPKYSAAGAPLFPVDLPSLVARHDPEHTARSRSPPEVHQKSILYEQATVNKPAKTEHRASEYSSGKPHRKQKQQQEQESDGINMKGENVGAVMHITQSSDATEIHKIKRPSNEEKNEKTNKSSTNIPGKSFMNTNFQGLNNSIMVNSSLSHRNPGLHLAFSKNPTHGASLRDSSH